MKKTYPVYTSNRKNPEAKQVFNSLSKKNKTAILNFMSIASINAKSKKRLDNMNRGLIRFFDFLEKDWDEIDYNDFIEVSKAISNSGLGVYARNGDRNFIKRFLQENFDDWRTRFKDMKLMKLETKTEEHKLSHKDLITTTEINKLIKATTNMKYKALIILLLESGARPEEILKLRWSDTDLNKNLIYLYSAKTEKKRFVPIKESVVHLRRLKNETEPKDDDLIFPSITKGKKIMTNSGLNFMLNDLRKKAGISKKIHGYTFRHTRLSELITKLSPKVYEDISGHSLTMGMKTYAHLKKDIHIKEMQEKVFDVEELSEDQKHEFERRLDVYEDALRVVVETMNKDRKETGISKKQKALAFKQLLRRGFGADLSNLNNQG